MNAMDFSDRGRRNLFLWLGVIACLLLIIFFSKDVFLLDNSSEDDISLIIEDGLNDLEEIEDEILNDELGDFSLSLDEIKDVFIVDYNGPDYVQKRSLRVEIENVYLKSKEEGGYDVYFDVLSTDLLVDEAQSKDAGNYYLRSPILWQSMIYLYRGEVLPLFLCGDYYVEDNIWRSTYCAGIDELDDRFFDQTIRFVYTDERLEDLEDLSPLGISKLGKSYVFELVIPKEFYAD
jgi:hypothetical protein